MGKLADKIHEEMEFLIVEPTPDEYGKIVGQLTYNTEVRVTPEVFYSQPNIFDYAKNSIAKRVSRHIQNTLIKEVDKETILHAIQLLLSSNDYYKRQSEIEAVVKKLKNIMEL